MAIEGALILLALLCGIKLRFWNDPGEFEFYTALPDFAGQAAIMVAVFQLCFYYNDLYDLNIVRRRGEQLIHLGQALGAACMILGLLYFLFPALLLGRGVFFITMALVVGSIMFARIALDKTWQMTAPPANVLILGAGNLALTVLRELSWRDDLNMKIVGVLSDKPQDFSFGDQFFGFPVLGTASELEPVGLAHGVARIIVAMEDRRGALPVRDLVKLRVEGLEVEEAQTTLAALTGRVSLELIRPSWLVFSEGFHRSKITVALKRVIDLCLGLAGLAIFAPLMAVIAIAIKLDSPGPIFYRQERVGLKGRRFSVLKFRSMQANAEAANGAQWALERDDRATRLGRLLRKFRLDELPQFINVIRGEMSFVGPRPERPVFVDQLREKIPYYDERHSVRPGVTGWAQVQYHYGASIEDAMRKLEYDLFYLKNMSLAFDCAIVFQTVRIVLSGQGGR